MYHGLLGVLRRPSMARSLSYAVRYRMKCHSAGFETMCAMVVFILVEKLSFLNPYYKLKYKCGFNTRLCYRIEEGVLYNNMYSYGITHTVYTWINFY